MTIALHREHIEWCDLWIRSAEKNRYPRVLLIGDSICRGYCAATQKRLDEIADCARVATSRFVSDPVFYQELSLVLDQAQFSVIHFNNGLHGWDYSEKDYADGLPLLIEFLRRKAPSAKLIWATSTPLYQAHNLGTFNPEWHHRVIERNRLAAEVMTAHGIPSHDLFNLALGKLGWFTQDGVHYQDEGYAHLATQVAAHIQALIPSSADRVPLATSLTR